MARDHGGSSDKAEVIPPSVPGGKGLTRREIEAKIKVSRLSASPEQEVIPPDSSGKRGVTVREIEAMMLDERKDNGREFLVLPPQSENKGGGGNEGRDLRIDGKASKGSKGTTGDVK